jgi:hypothetical protein
MADAIGLTILLLFVALWAVVVPASEVEPLFWFFIYLALAVVAWNFWRHERAPKRPVGWLVFIAAVVVVGTLSFAVDAFIGLSHHPTLPLLEAAKSTGMDYVLNVIAWPSLISVGIAGMARSAYKLCDN